MTSGLRKAHKYIWLAIVVAVPVLILFAIKDLDVFTLESDTSLNFEAAKNNVLKVSENELIKVSMIEKDSVSSIEIILKSTLKNASSIVYTLNDNNKKGEIIGQITTVGIYTFSIKESLKGIIIYDSFKESPITKLAF